MKIGIQGPGPSVARTLIHPVVEGVAMRLKMSQNGPTQDSKLDDAYAVLIFA
jgi:hypothetical protein